MVAVPGVKDHFSGHARSYRRFRPHYPRELYVWLAAQSPANSVAVDVATGNGQAALGLAEFFETVIATDASAAQLELAGPHPRVSYRCEPAERISLPDASADLVTAAQAAHWFEWTLFAGEARRVLRPGGLLAVWCYGRLLVLPAIDKLIDEFSRVVALPFPEVPSPGFEMRADWDCRSALGYLESWSAVQRCRTLSRRDPLALLEPLLAGAWGAGTRALRWPLVLKAGRA